MDLPMLDEAEWEQVGPLFLHAAVDGRPVPLGERITANRDAALDAYERLTGFRETNAEALWHHRIFLYGPPCPACRKPLRTPQARYCPACGWSSY